MKAWVVLAALAGCAKAGEGDNSATPDGGFAHHDGSTVHHDTTTLDPDSPQIDAAPPIDTPPPIDAAHNPVSITLSETNGTTVNGNMATCNDGTATGDDQWYRAFSPASYGVTGPFTVQSVTLGIQLSYSAEITVVVGTYSGTVGGSTFQTGAFAPLATQVYDVPDNEAVQSQTIGINTTIPAGSSLAVEVSAPDMEDFGYFVIGGTNGGETVPGYQGSVECGISPPSTTAGGPGTGAVVLDVSGQYTP